MLSCGVFDSMHHPRTAALSSNSYYHRVRVCLLRCSSETLLSSGAKHSGGYKRPRKGVLTIFFFFKFTPQLPFLRTVELPFEVITYTYSKRYVMFSTIVPSYVHRTLHRCNDVSTMALTIKPFINTTKPRLNVQSRCDGGYMPYTIPTIFVTGLHNNSTHRYLLD